jgi:hypothetical protein
VAFFFDAGVRFDRPTPMMQVVMLMVALGHASAGAERPLALVLVPPAEEPIPPASRTLLRDLLRQLGVRPALRDLPESAATLTDQVDAARALAHQTGADVAFVVPLPRPTRVLVYLPAEGSSGREGRLLVRDVAAAPNPASALEAVATILRGTVLALRAGARVELPHAEAAAQDPTPQLAEPRQARQMRLTALGNLTWLDQRAWPGASMAVALSAPAAALPWRIELAGAWQPAQTLQRAQTTVDMQRWSLTVSAMLHTSLGPTRLGSGIFARLEWLELRVGSPPVWVARSQDATDRSLSTGPACRLEWPGDSRWRVSVDARLGWQPGTRRYLVAGPENAEVLLDAGHVYASLSLGLSVALW